MKSRLWRSIFRTSSIERHPWLGHGRARLLRTVQNAFRASPGGGTAQGESRLVVRSISTTLADMGSFVPFTNPRGRVMKREVELKSRVIHLTRNRCEGRADK